MKENKDERKIESINKKWKWKEKKSKKKPKIIIKQILKMRNVNKKREKWKKVKMKEKIEIINQH